MLVRLSRTAVGAYSCFFGEKSPREYCQSGLLSQTILKRLKTPYRDDVEFDEATLYVAASTNSTLSCNNEKTRLFNAQDTRKTNLDVLPDDEFNMRLS